MISYTKESLNTLISSIDNGRFNKLFEAIELKSVCMNCSYFNHSDKVKDSYRCRSAPGCPGATLSSELISYLLWKMGEKTEKEHKIFMGL